MCSTADYMKTLLFSVLICFTFLPFSVQSETPSDLLDQLNSCSTSVDYQYVLKKMGFKDSDLKKLTRYKLSADSLVNILDRKFWGGAMLFTKNLDTDTVPETICQLQYQTGTAWGDRKIYFCALFDDSSNGYVSLYAKDFDQMVCNEPPENLLRMQFVNVPGTIYLQIVVNCSNYSECNQMVIENSPASDTIRFTGKRFEYFRSYSQ